jgi:phospholipase C
VPLSALLVIPGPAFSQPNEETRRTDTPIKHVIVLIGENRTFDHLFATYVPTGEDSISNLLSKGIINADGTPGQHFKKAQPRKSQSRC